MSERDRCPRCAATLPAGRLSTCPRCLLTGELPPVVLADRLELVEVIGEGGAGTVWRARDRQLDREVAVKLVEHAHPEVRRRFLREARALARLNHAHVVTLHEIGEQDELLYLVLELVEGGSVADHGPVPVERAVDVVRQVCAALAFAHERGVVHRDIKPGNVLVDAQGTVKVADFGIARLLDPDGAGPTVTRPGLVAGTPHYMAPEALAGADPDPRMDVFAAGVLLYELVTGRVPAGDWAPLDDPELDAIVRRALAADPERRFPSAPALGLALTQWSATGSVPGSGVGSDADLPPDEVGWRRSVALVLALTSAVTLWALFVSITPRVLAPDEVLPLVMLEPIELADGRISSRARFETWPMLGAVGTAIGALAAVAWLWGRWRRAGLLGRWPARPLPEAGWVLGTGLVSIALYALRLGFEWGGIDALAAYIPIIGGPLEIVALFLIWSCVLEARRTGRSLADEPRVWLGALGAALPPIIELGRALGAG